MATGGTIPLDLDSLAGAWQRALDAASSALEAGRDLLLDQAARRHDLQVERHEVATLIAQLAADSHIEPRPWLPRGSVTPSMLGVEAGTRACIFDLDGVLTDSGALHAAAWAETLDPFLVSIANETHWYIEPFDRDRDYRLYFDGRPRLDGIRLFLEARGLHRPVGDPGDPFAAGTLYGIARRKGDVLDELLARQPGVAALTDARRYLQAVGYAHLGRAVVSASTTALPMLDAARLTALIEVRVDAETIRVGPLRPRPAPDVLLTACGKLGVEPRRAVSLTHSGAGIVACRAAGIAAIGIATGAQAERLRDFGAGRVVPSLSALLAPGLREAA